VSYITLGDMGRLRAPLPGATSSMMQQVAAHFGQKRGDPGFSRRFDLNRDGVVNVDDLQLAGRPKRRRLSGLGELAAGVPWTLLAGVGLVAYLWLKGRKK
jgi:hypothetical protein